MKNANGYNTKDNVITAIVIAAMAALTISALFNTAPANAEATMPVFKMETIVVTAQREQIVKLDTIVVTASRNATV
jgi:hypothetical protein